MNVKYKNKITEKMQHGNNSSSNLIKTRRGLAPVVPIGCVPFGRVTIDIANLSNIPSGEVVYNSDGMPISVEAPLNLPFLQVSTNGSTFENMYAESNQDIILMLMMGRPDYKSTLGPDNIDPVTIVTRLGDTYGSFSFMIGIMALESIIGLSGPTQEAILLAQEFYKDVYGEDLDLAGGMSTTTPLTGMSSNGILKGTTKDWNIVDMINSVQQADMADAPKLVAVDKETSVIYRRTGSADDLYDTAFGSAAANEVTLTSCSTVTIEPTQYTCVPTVKTFRPTVEVQMNDGYAAYLMRVRFDVNYRRFTEGGEEKWSEVVYVDRVVTTNFEEPNFYGDNDNRVVINVIDEQASPLEICRAMFNIVDGSPNSYGYPNRPLNNIGGIGTDDYKCNLIASYNDLTGDVTIAGMFDENAVTPPTEWSPWYQHIYNDVRYVNVEQTVAKITLEPATGPANLPYYGKCYVTEQFGEAVVIQSCLALVNDMPS